jgi:hypothetical protein
MERDETRAADERRDAARGDGDSYTEREQRLADADLAAHERTLDDAGRPRDPGVARTGDTADAGRAGILHHDDQPGIADHVGEAAGGIGGAVAGAAIGSVAGPVGTVVGGIIGAMGGWWTGRTIAEAATRISESDEEFYRTHYDAAPDRLPTWRYDDVQPAYYLGHLAGYNPGYVGREFDEIEPELERGWATTAESSRADWTGVRNYARVAYARGSTAARDAGWLSQPEAVRRGDSYELATPAGTNDAASRSPIEGEDLSPEAIDYMADNINPQGTSEGASGAGALDDQGDAGAADRSSSNRAAGLTSTGASGSFATGGGSTSGASSSASGGTGSGTSERASFNDPVAASGDVGDPGAGNNPPRSGGAGRSDQERITRSIGDEERARSLSDSDWRAGSPDVERDSASDRRDPGPDAQ